MSNFNHQQPQSINLCGEVFHRIDSLDRAIDNLSRWLPIGFPDCHNYKIRNYLPSLNCYHWGRWDSQSVHMLEISCWVGGKHHRWSHLLVDVDESMPDREFGQLILDRLIASDWVEGTFDHDLSKT